MKRNIIYLMGAGRSGTTALATFLGNHANITNLGEMHQFFEHIHYNKPCSCGNILNKCLFWRKILQALPQKHIKESGTLIAENLKFEYHSAFIKHLLKLYKKKDLSDYLSIQEEIFSKIFSNIKDNQVIDSAKYIGRALSLLNSKKFNIKIIYCVRDVRGVIYSFGKKVQTSRKPLFAIFYYSIINFFGQIVYLFLPKKTIIKIKYEDLIFNPKDTLLRLSSFLNIDLTDIITKIENNVPFQMGHIIGGNRIKKNQTIRFKVDKEWEVKISRSKQILYYFLALPLMVINKYKI